jgi:hypothetical protein
MSNRSFSVRRISWVIVEFRVAADGACRNTMARFQGMSDADKLNDIM